jgi:hypothetical protein
MQSIQYRFVFPVTCRYDIRKEVLSSKQFFALLQLRQQHQFLILLMARRTIPYVTSNISNLAHRHFDEGIRGASGFIVSGEMCAALITGEQIAGQQVEREADQTIMAKRTGANMRNNLAVVCGLLSVPLPIHF